MTQSGEYRNTSRAEGTVTDKDTKIDTCASYNWEIGTDPQVPLPTPEWANRTSPTIMIDACMAPAVKALWDAGYVTLSSCCGHGREPRPSLVLDNAEKDYSGIRADIATVDDREFDLFQWRLVKITPFATNCGLAV